MSLQETRSELVKRRDQEIARYNSQIEDLDRQIRDQAHADGLARYPKWAAMTPEQQNHCAFLAYDPDNPEVPLD